MSTYWIENLPGIPPLPVCAPGYSRPDRVTASFVEEGYFVKYFEYPIDKNRTVAQFYRPQEFIIPAHPVYSTVQSLDRASMVPFTYSNIFRTLRHYPVAKLQYRQARKTVEQKIADRIKLAGIEKDTTRFRFVRERQAWIFDKVPDALVAGYLGVSVERLKELKRIFL